MELGQKVVLRATQKLQIAQNVAEQSFSDISQVINITPGTAVATGLFMEAIQGVHFKSTKSCTICVLTDQSPLKSLERFPLGLDQAFTDHPPP